MYLARYSVLVDKYFQGHYTLTTYIRYCAQGRQGYCKITRVFKSVTNKYDENERDCWDRGKYSVHMNIYTYCSARADHHRPTLASHDGKGMIALTDPSPKGDCLFDNV